MMKFRKIEGLQDVCPERIEGTEEWYCCKIAKNCFCDLYEAEEIVKAGQVYEGMTCVLIHYPDRNVYYPFLTKENVYVDAPVYWDGALYFLVVDFTVKKIEIVAFDTTMYEIQTVEEFSLDEVEDCYNLMLRVAPVLLVRDGNKKGLEVIYPEKKHFKMSNHESFLFKDEEKMYFSEWQEDPEYREIVVVRDWNTGKEIERFDGQLWRMPNGDVWVM